MRGKSTESTYVKHYVVTILLVAIFAITVIAIGVFIGNMCYGAISGNNEVTPTQTPTITPTQNPVVTPTPVSTLQPAELGFNSGTQQTSTEQPSTKFNDGFENGDAPKDLPVQDFTSGSTSAQNTEPGFNSGSQQSSLNTANLGYKSDSQNNETFAPQPYPAFNDGFESGNVPEDLPVQDFTQ